MKQVFKILEAALLGLIVLLSLMAVVLMIKFSPLWSSEAAGWVQAIGSIAAIAVAIFVMQKQNAHSIKLILDSELRAALQRTDAVSAVVDRAHRQIGNCISHFEKGASTKDTQQMNSSTEMVANVMAELRVVLMSIPIHELGSYDLVLGVHQTIDTLNLFDKAIQAVKKTSLDEKYFASVPNQAALVRRNLETAVTTFSKGCNTLRSQG